MQTVPKKLLVCRGCTALMNAAGVSGPNSRHLGKIRDDGNRTGTVRDRATEIGVSGASQPISNGLLMLIRGNHIVISVLLSEIELESSAGFL
jgi:hypothetical protein